MDVWNFREYYKPSNKPLFLTFNDYNLVLKFIHPKLSQLSNICLFKLFIPVDGVDKKYKFLCIRRKKNFKYRLGIKSIYNRIKSKHTNSIINVSEIYYDVLRQINKIIRLITSKNNITLYPNTFSFIKRDIYIWIRGTSLLLRYGTTQDKIRPNIPMGYNLIEFINETIDTDIEYLCNGQRIPYKL